jgi:nucleoside-diphosphate-sugar epimerase
MTNPKILVTGGAGYKGVPLVTKLLARGLEVTLLDNFMYGFDSVLHLVSEPRLKIVQADIRNLDKALLSEFDVIYHLAGISGMPACAANPHAAETINVQATRDLVRALSREQVLIYASTTSFYGATGQECDETVPVQPVSLYGRTKYEAERIVQGRERSISLRFATIFGASPRMRTDLLVNDFAYKAVNDRAIVIFAGQSKRTFMHLEDAVAAYLFALDHADRMAGQVFNAGDEQLNFSKLDIARAIQAHVRFELIDSSLADLDVRNFLVSFQRIRALGYQTVKTLDDGVRELLKLYAFYRAGGQRSLI